MANLLETLGSFLQNKMDNEEKAPLHVGETMNLWLFLTTVHEANIFTQVGINSTNDDELLEMLQDSSKACEKQTKQVRDFLIKAGVPLPPLTEHKPTSSPNEIPLGVKLTDDEIANGVSIKDVSIIMLCAAGITQSIRTDIGSMFLQLMLERITFDTSLKSMMIKRGWVKVPPYYTPSGSPST
jgi:hypothetical protein